MKEYRLIAWPELRPPFDRIAFRRLVSDMSQRHLSLQQLCAASGLRRQDVRQFIEVLDAQGLINERESGVSDSLFGSLRPLGGWLRKAFDGSAAHR